jgi:hypothetical protein
MAPCISLHLEVVIGNVVTTYAAELWPGRGRISIVGTHIHIIRQPAAGPVPVKIAIYGIDALKSVVAGAPEIRFIYAIRIFNIQIEVLFTGAKRHSYKYCKKVF